MNAYPDHPARLCTIVAALLIGLTLTNSPEAAASPVIFWVSQPAMPGDVVLAYGGDLEGVRSVEISRLQDQIPQGPWIKAAPSNITGEVTVPVMQASDHSLKFVLPKSLAPGVFALRYGARRPQLIDVPQVYWCQTTRLLPGIGQDEAVPGSSIQIIGRNFIPAPAPGIVKVVLRDISGRISAIHVSQIDKYSLVATLPSSLPFGKYELLVHNGYGGSAAWSGGLNLVVKNAVVWPAQILNIRDFGALGDNIHSDSTALRKALANAKANGGGIIYFPAGTYRLDGWFQIPHRTVLRGEARDLVWLKWPLTDPASSADILPAVIFTSGEVGIENLSFMVRNAETIVRDLSWDAATTGRPPLPELQSEMLLSGKEHDFFVRNVDFQLLYYSGWQLRPESSVQWKLNGLGWRNNELVKIIALDGVRNVEVSNCRFIGGTQRILDVANARFEKNEFNNQWATLSWTDLGGEYITFQNNIIDGASSWRDNLLPVRHLYCAFNRNTNLVAGGREALTFDVNRLFPRKNKPAPGGASAPWQGRVRSATYYTVSLQDANLAAHAYRDLDLLVLDGRGAGQHRTIRDSGADSFTVEPAWDVVPDATSVVLAYRLSGDCILYRNEAEDTSVLLEIWGFLFDVTIDGNAVSRGWGMWAVSGWFVQWLNNRLDVAVTLNPGFGPGASSEQERSPELSSPDGVLGFAVGGRLLELPLPFPYVRAAVIRGNQLSYGYGVLVRFGYDGTKVSPHSAAIQDIVIDANKIDHTPVGIEIDRSANGVLVADNRFIYVREPTRLTPALDPMHTH